MRLTKDMRESIVNDMVESAIVDRATALAIEENALAERVYKEVVIGTESAMSYIRPLPDKFFPGGSKISVILCRPNGEPCSNGYYTVRLATTVQMPYYAYNRAVRVNVETALGGKLSDLIDNQRALSKDRESLERKIYAAVNSYNTVEGLIKAWPEAKAFCPVARTTNLPVVRFDEINGEIARIKSVK